MVGVVQRRVGLDAEHAVVLAILLANGEEEVLRIDLEILALHLPSERGEALDLGALHHVPSLVLVGGRQAHRLHNLVHRLGCAVDERGARVGNRDGVLHLHIGAPARDALDGKLPVRGRLDDRQPRDLAGVVLLVRSADGEKPAEVDRARGRAAGAAAQPEGEDSVVEVGVVPLDRGEHLLLGAALRNRREAQAEDAVKLGVVQVEAVLVRLLGEGHVLRRQRAHLQQVL